MECTLSEIFELNIPRYEIITIGGADKVFEINRENKVRAFDNAGQVMDFATTLAQTYGDKYSWS